MNLNYFNRQPYQLQLGQEFFQAVKKNDKIIVLDMLTNTKEYIFEIDCTGETALHWACKRGFKKIAKILLDFGAEVDKLNASKKTPLYYALRGEHPALIKLLFFFGASPYSSKQLNYRELYQNKQDLQDLFQKSIKLQICLSMIPVSQRFEQWNLDRKQIYEQEKEDLF